MVEFRQSASKDGITASTVLLLLLLVDASVLLVAGGHTLIGAPFYPIEMLFSLESEPTIPGWVASVKLLIIACLVAVLSLSTGTGRGAEACAPRCGARVHRDVL